MHSNVNIEMKKVYGLLVCNQHSCRDQYAHITREKELMTKTEQSNISN